MNKILGMLALVGWTLLGSKGYAASVVIDDFESGGLNGWYAQSYLGRSTATSTALGTAFSTLEGRASGVVLALSASIYDGHCERDPWNADCDLPMPLVPTNGSKPTYGDEYSNDRAPVHGIYLSGAYIGRDITVHAGDSLTWRWAAYGDAAPLGDGFDYVRFTASGLNGQVWFNAHGPSETFVFSESGIWSIYFGIAQREDPQGYSAVVLDSIILNTVPEPSGLALALLAGMALWQARRTAKSEVGRGHQASA